MDALHTLAVETRKPISAGGLMPWRKQVTWQPQISAWYAYMTLGDAIGRGKRFLSPTIW
jgi:hypothetical protein